MKVTTGQSRIKCRQSDSKDSLFLRGNDTIFLFTFSLYGCSTMPYCDLHLNYLVNSSDGHGLPQFICTCQLLDGYGFSLNF